MKGLRVVSACALAVAALVMASCQTPPTGGNTPPTASFTASPLVGLAPLPVNFDASASFDTGGSISAYEWTFGDGATATGVTTSHTFTVDGTYAVQLKVTDNGGASATTTRTITVGVANVPPTAIAGVDHTSGVAPLNVAFSSAGSGDVDGSITTWAWDFGDGTTPSNAQNPTHIYLSPGSYTAVLTVTDDDGAVASDSVTVTVSANQPPVAASSATPSTGKAPLSVAFSSAGSSDPDGGALSYSWSFDDGTPNSNAANPNHSYVAAGTYHPVLTVTDAQGATASHSSTVVVNANQAPVAVAGANVTSGPAPLVVTFDATGSTDSDGTIASYLWTFPGSVTSSQTSPQFTFAAQGTYAVSLQVTDDSGATSTDTISIVVGAAPNVAPTAVASAAPTTGKRNLAVTFNSSASTDSDGTIVSRSWTFGDGATSSAANPSHTYTTAGTFTATLTVTDNAGAIASDTVVITVTPNQAPIAAGAATPSTQKQGKVVNFSSAGSSDPDGTIAAYKWDFADGTAPSSSANPGHVYANPGTYQVALTVTDDTGDSTTTTVTVVVVANQAPTAVINAAPQSGPRPLAVTFSSAGSADPDGTFSTSWNFGNGNTSTAANPTTTYNTDGVYTATLTVTDDNGATDSKSIVINVTVDDDGDGISPPADCNDNDASIHPGAPDTLDAAGKDTNCDGVDGIAADTIVVSAATGSDTPTCGTSPATPCQTIPYGVTRATAASRSVVLVTGDGAAYGSFSLNSTPNLTVRGGYGPSFAARSGTTTVNGGVAVTSSSAVALRDLTVNGPGGVNTTGILVNGSSVTLASVVVDSGVATGAGSSAYGVRAINGSTVTATASTITAKPGIAGTAGGAPAPATPSAACNGNNGGDTYYSFPSIRPGEGGTAGCTAPAGTSQGGNGGKGGTWSGAGDAGSAGGGSAAGGIGGCGSTTGCGTDAGGGSGGAAGAAGSAGAGGSANLTTAGVTFVGSDGGAGGSGGVGGGGGGGGGGKTASTYGGGGGAGGNGGAAGVAATIGGHAGGGSFGIYAIGSSVSLTNTTVTAGAGGAGGAGSPGGAGGAAGNGGAGGTKNCCSGGGGGGGGAGGGGGGGGGAGGGAGGPSIAVFRSGAGTYTVSASTLNHSAVAASGGAGGSGGAAGAAGAVGSGTQGGGNGTAGGTAPGSNGQTGSSGVVAQSWNGGTVVP